MKLTAKAAFFYSALLGVVVPTVTYVLILPLAANIESQSTIRLVYQWTDLLMSACGWAAFVFFIVGVIHRKS